MARSDDHYHPLVRRVARALRQRCHVTPGSAIVVGTSGGADSVALLRALAMLAQRRKWRLRLIVGHIQHHLREEAEGDSAFVAQLAETLGLAFARRDIEVATLPGNVEANARSLRYDALADVAREHDARFIATAHHSDDQLETMLMRFLRGSSVAGLRGIAWSRPVQDGARHADDSLRIIRPMLGVEHASAVALLDQLGQAYREDATNLDTSRTRAKLRHEVVPLLKSMQAHSGAKANALADHFREVHALIQASADDARQAHAREKKGSGVVLLRQQARQMNRVVLAEVLRRALLEAGCDADQLTRGAMLPVVRAAQDTVGGTRRFAFAKRVMIEITREAIAVATSVL